MRKPAAVADWELLGQETPCKKAIVSVAAPRELTDDATDAGVPASEADAKPGSKSALASVASA